MRRRLRALATTLTLALCGALAGAATATATPQPSPDRATTPTSAARQAGVERAGGAFMGWSAEGHGRAQAPGTAYRTLGGTKLTAEPLESSGVEGLDVSGWQGDVDWNSWWDQGKRFAYVKATEGTGYTNDHFTQQYNGSYDVGMIRGGYHFALPDASSGAAQADYFVDHGGGWSADGKTLPGVLDIEYNPYGATCYGLSQAQMRDWVASFTSEYQALTGRDPVIYTNFDWWNTCTGDTTAFNQTNPLWVARYSSSPGTLPGAWPFHTFWQYTSSPLDLDRFNGSYDRLEALALG